MELNFIFIELYNYEYYFILICLLLSYMAIEGIAQPIMADPERPGKIHNGLVNPIMPWFNPGVQVKLKVKVNPITTSIHLGVKVKSKS